MLQWNKELVSKDTAKEFVKKLETKYLETIANQFVYPKIVKELEERFIANWYPRDTTEQLQVRFEAESQDLEDLKKAEAKKSEFVGRRDYLKEALINIEAIEENMRTLEEQILFFKSFE